MPTYPFPEFAPDRSALDPEATAYIRNVIPNANGYGPFHALVPYTSALASACKGAFLARSASGTYAIFAGVSTKIFKASGTGWDDVSSGTMHLIDGQFWSMVQYGDSVMFANIADVIQTYLLGSSTDFANLAGSPPQLAHIWVESGYFGGGNATGAERTIYRAGLNDATYWTFGMRGSTFQTFPDGGFVQGAVTREQGALIFQEKKLRQLINQPGEEVGFRISEVEDETGPIAPNSIVSVGQRIFYLAEEGFHMVGSPSVHIGAERIDKTFLDDVDLNKIDQVQGVADPVRKIAWWRYCSINNSSDDYSDKLIGYAWELNRWAYAEINLEWILPLALPGYTLEELSSILGYTNLDTMPFSLDSRAFKGGRPAFAGFDSLHRLGLFEGDTLEAVLDTADIPMGGEGKRSFVTGFRPVGDASGVYGQVFSKGTFGSEDATPTAEAAQNSSTGLIPVRSSGRSHRFRARIPAGSVWNHINGVEVPSENARAAGRR